MPMIVTSQLTKRFDDLTAVDALDLSIDEGEIYGILGPNGAGKTTTVRMLCGLTRPTSGKGAIDGMDVVKNSVAIRRILGIVPQGNVLDRDLTVKENLVYHSKLHGLRKDYYQRRIAEVLEFVHLDEKTDAAPLTLSGGMKRRFTIAKALVHEPKVLFLDEPTTGLDPQARQSVWKKIQQLKEQGKTIVLTTHYMEEAELLCDRVGIIDNGRLIGQGTPGELKAMLTDGCALEVRFESEVDVSAITSHPIVTSHETTGGKHVFHADDRKALLRLLLDKHCDDIATLNMREPKLEDVFLEMTGSEVRE